MKAYRIISFFLTASFVAAGLIFLFFPGRVLLFFNSCSHVFGLPPAPVREAGFFNILAAGYMYLVALLAFWMYRCPENKFFPLLLANGKFASAILSVCFALVLKPYLIFWVNSLVDSLIGVVVLILYMRIKRLNP
ncbi:MAG: hypothetical protein JXB23_15355 [Candidatus Aminicenantes bacterium]|nr:hypothetical protein [Candidatus Aminicenantes bacterium]